MNRTRTSLSVLLLALVSMLMFGLTGVMAADTTPSFELTGIAGVNTCQGGIAQFNYFLNHDGAGSVLGRFGSDFSAATGGYEAEDFDYYPAGAGFGYFGLPDFYPANTIVYFEVSTYSGEWASGTRTFYSRIEFDCTTGHQVGNIINQAYPDGLPRPNFDIVDGPAFEHPGDIVSVDPGILIVRPEVVGDPIGRPQDLGRINVGG